jgi:hypothetical protein
MNVDANVTDSENEQETHHHPEWLRATARSNRIQEQKKNREKKKEEYGELPEAAWEGNPPLRPTDRCLTRLLKYQVVGMQLHATAI